ncbi:hypothetical protein GCM10028805_36470 [Spirosoma harenae]
MEITPALLMYLGFTAAPDRLDTYDYKGITGRLVEATGEFYFRGFSLPITSEVDLRFQLMLIDYHPDESLPSFDVSLN